MKRLLNRKPKMLTVITLVAFIAHSTASAYAESPVKLKKFTGTIDFGEEPTPFTLEGTASHLGRFSCYGEVEFVPGDEEGTLVGTGVAVFVAANGDLIVANVAWDVDAGDGEFLPSRIHFSWRDSVEFSDGTVVSSDGHFVKNRPAGLVVISIIGILVGLLLPAVNS
jgi:hypothetical protein